MQRVGLVGITNILIAISSLILLPIITKNFSITDYGIWVQINTTIGLITIISTLGLPFTMVRFLSVEKDKKTIQEGFYSIASIVLVSCLFISIIIVLFSNSIASALFNDNINLTILLSIIVFFASLNGLLINYFRTFNQMKRYSIFYIFQTYFGVLIVSYIAISGFGIYYAALGLLIANFITFIIMFSFIISNIGFKIPKLKNTKEYLSFGLPLIPSNLSFWVVDSIDRYVIGIILGLSFVGYYTPGYTLGNMIVMILAPFSLLLPSILPEYYEQHNIKKVKIYLKYSLKCYLLIAIPAAFGLSILSKPILLILTNPEISSNGYFITPFIAFSMLLFGVYGIISNILVLRKKTGLIGIIWILVAVLNLILNMMLVPFFGIIGAAIVTFIAYVIAFTLTHIYSIKYIKFTYDLPFIFKSIAASILMSIIIVINNPEGILSLLTTIIISIFVYLIFLVLFKGIDNKEVKFMKEIFGL